ncbi:hypothetical protein [Polaribacter sp. ALD11]|uniref:hypothetical protein n=1 Tax=Polaribacter sp. ALD11 TaxID=2058137 RepID=UPI0012FDA88A|nr:hypothetical protein [Polaribacter sp. ALD11]
MKKIEKALLILIILLISSCNLKNEVIINADFEQFLEDYIKKNPIPKYLETTEDRKSATPSYNLYFWKKGLDSIIEIRLNPFLVSFNPLNSSINEGNEEIITEENPDGYFIFKQNAIVVFDENNYGINIINKSNLINKIPDSLKWDFEKLNNHISNKPNYYNISKKRIEITE